MSLPRVGSLETFLSVPTEGERSRRGSNSSTGTALSIRPRRLSFNPLPESWDPVIAKDSDHPANTIGAFEVPEWKRIREYRSFDSCSPSCSLTAETVQIVCAVIYCFLAAGVVFGYAAI